MGRKLIDLTGRRFERLAVLEYLGREHHSSKWRCRCDCGAEITVLSSALTTGTTKSCGCFRQERMGHLTLKHGERGGDKRVNGSSEYKAWDAMRQRCRNPKNKDYEGYGGRGIRVCSRWDVFANFLVDMGRKPSPQHSIDRRNGNGHYEPTNCRWATELEQARNRSNNRAVGSSRTLKEAAEKVGIPYVTVQSRLGHGWTVDDALSRPIDARHVARANRAIGKARSGNKGE